MLKVRKLALSLCLGLALFVLTGFGSKRFATSNEGAGDDSIAHHIAVLKSGKPQQKAAAAYWLGQKRSAASSAIDRLVDLLGETTAVDAAQYRLHPLDRMTLGEEAAAALVNIGHPAIEPLIRVLKTSPQPEARKNAAWALGALHEMGATADSSNI